MQCVPLSKQASSRPQSQGNLEFRNPMSGRHWRRGRVEKPDLVVARHVNHKIGSNLRGLAFAACGDRCVSAGTKSAVRKPPYDADPRTGARIEVFYVTAGSKRLAGAELVGSDRIASAA